MYPSGFSQENSRHHSKNVFIQELKACITTELPFWRKGMYTREATSGTPKSENLCTESLVTPNQEIKDKKERRKERN